jgi:hypothetical protein
MKLLSTLAIMAAVLLWASPSQAAEFDKYEIESVQASLSTTQAGAHPDFTAGFELTTDSTKAPFAQTRDVSVELPPGLIGNPNAIPQCTTLQLGLSPETSHCPQDSEVGVTEISLFGLGTFVEPIYNMTPPEDTVARFGFIAGLFPTFINVEVRSQSDYGVTASVEGVASIYPLKGATTTIWGVPADPAHDAFRLTATEAHNGEAPPGGGRASGLPPTPFITNPTSCEGPLPVTISVDSYQEPGRVSSKSASLPAISGCGKLGFEPKFALTPTSSQAAAPSGLDAELTIPQDETVKGLATSQLRDAVVTLPKGMTLASGAADGLQACSDEQAGFHKPGPSNCPEASKLGTAEFDVPALPRILHGALYQRSPEPGDLFRVWLISDELGVHVKIPGQIKADPVSGQLTSLFLETPRVPLRGLKLHVFGGPRAPLANPPACGAYATHFDFTPWSGNAPVQGNAPMAIDQGCATGGFAPRLSAGVTSPAAGAFSAFVLNLIREDGEQNVAGLNAKMPPGLLAKLAGVSLCPEPQATSGDCPAGSKVADVAVAAGPGSAPLWIPQPGKAPTAVYLAGPYHGAPYSLSVKVPAQAGPFDLGTVVTRAAIFVNPETAQVTVRSDPLPQILEGVPVYYRHLHVDVDRPDFTLNPTNCDPHAVQATVTSSQGATATPASRFQAAGCGELPFAPKLSLRLFGKTNRGAHPRLRAVLKARRGDANIAWAQAALPHSEFLDQNHIGTVCTRVQFVAGQCPARSIYGRARAISPLLDKPLEGPVYLRSSSHELPDLVAALKGQIEVDVAGRIDSVNGGIRTTFESVPDAPVTKFLLTMQGGNKGLLINSRNLCATLARATLKLEAQNGKSTSQRPLLQNDCAGTGRRNPKHR